MNLIVDDGYTATKKFDAVPGLHPEFTVTFRPALLAERRHYSEVAATGATKLNKYETDAVRKYVTEIDGTPITKIEVAKIRPLALEKILNLVFGYTPEEELADAKNS